MLPTQKLKLQEEVNKNLSIEIDSIQQIRDEHIHPLTLHFLLSEMESTVIKINSYYVFKNKVRRRFCIVQQYAREDL